MKIHMGPQTTGQPHPQQASASLLPPNLADVALIDATTCAAAGAMSISWWHEEVRAGRAPAPAIRKPRCTRWRLADVHAFWGSFAANAASDTEASERMTARAKHASSKARDPAAVAKAQASRKARSAAREGATA